MKRSIGLLAALSFVALSSACIPKKANKSTAQSLDNLAAGKKVTANECKGNVALLSQWEGRINFGLDIRGTMDSPEFQVHKDKYLARVKQYLSAVPQELQKAFLDYGGEILLTGQAEAECNKPFSDPSSSHYVKEGGAKADSCFIYANGVDGTPTAGKAVMVVYQQINLSEIGQDSGISGLDKNEARLMHGGVRSIGMAFAQFFSKLSVIDPAKGAKPGIGNFKLEQNDTFEMAGLKEKLANMFLLEIALSGKYKLEDLEPLLGQGSAHTIRQAIFSDENAKKLKSDDLASLEPLKAATFLDGSSDLASEAEKTIRMNRFKDYVLGEGMDSLHCSNASRGVIETDFRNTKDLFKNLLNTADEAIRAFAKEISGGGSAGLVAAASKSEGGALSLYGTTGDAGGFYQGMQMGMLFRTLFGGMFNSMGGLGAGAGRPAGIAGIGRPGNCPNCANCMGNGCVGCPQCAAGSGAGQCSGQNCSNCPNGNCGSCSGGNCQMNV